MSDLVGNPEDRFSRVAAHLMMQINVSLVHENDTSTYCKLSIFTLAHKLRIL